MIRIKRIYDKPADEDGFRMLVDRLWPRGLSKRNAKVDLWLKEIAPSDGLRKWFSHDPGKWQDFRKKYEYELEGKKDLIAKIVQLEKKQKNITFVFSARDERHNNAVVLKEYLEKNLK